VLRRRVRSELRVVRPRETGDVASQLLTLLLDEELLQAMEDEGLRVGDQSLEETIARRLEEGVGFARIVGPTELLWRPVHLTASAFEVEVPRHTAEALGELSDDYGFDVDVIAGTILYNDACKPWIVREAELRVPFTPLRWEAGKGNIYSMRFDLPGYQIVFLRLLAVDAAGRDHIISRALLALAREVQIAGVLDGVPLRAEAIDFARKMVRTADLGWGGRRGRA